MQKIKNKTNIKKNTQNLQQKEKEPQNIQIRHESERK